MPKKRIEPKLIEAAISLFGEFGFEGVTTRAVAERADVMAYNIYRLFKTKGRLYLKALNFVVDRSINEMADFVLNYPGQADKKDELGSHAYAAVHRWYSSLSRDGARLLQQAMISNREGRDRAFAPMQNIINIVAKSIKGPKKAKVDFDPKTRSEALIMTLFQVKVSYPGPPEHEMKEVDRFLGDWIKELLPAASSRRT
jgi:AcrR family transcriptional regulator